jgi:formylglycine-generating enzyme required for sulfatase activity
MPRAKANQQLLESTLNTMLLVQGGSFMMGPNPNKVPDQVAPNNQPQHKVTLSSYYLMKYFVTFAQYDLYTKLIKGPWINTVPLRFRSKERSPNYPVQGVNWYQANGYCAYLKKLTGLPFSLPTEAQWEYAARSRGKDVEWATDDGTQKIGINAGKANGVGDTVAYQYAVNRFPPNPLGFYAMGDTVTEWVKDWDHGYTSKAQVNPQGPKNGVAKMIRGGSVESTAGFGIYYRLALKPNHENNIAGFRCALNTNKPMSELNAIANKKLKHA